MVTFKLYCATEYGQNMFIIVDGVYYPMSYDRDAVWVCDLDLADNILVKYRYVLQNHDNSQVSDSPKYRYLPKRDGHWVVEDTFGYRGVHSVFETKAFTGCLMKHNDAKPLPRLKQGDICYLLNAPGVMVDYNIVMVGDNTFLGNWDVSKGVKLTPSFNGWWFVVLPSDVYLTHSEYKFVVCDSITGTVVKWENGDNRRLPLMNGNKIISATIHTDYDWHGNGVSIPVFSLRSKNGWGVGEFSDIKLMVDWAAGRDFHLLQILPINDTVSTYTDSDSYPYRANSVYALHPMYLNMPKLGRLKDRTKMKVYEKQGQELNVLPKVDYSAVNALKWNYIKEIFEQEYETVVSSKDYKSFVKDNIGWLKDYAVFSCLREEFGTDKFDSWGIYSVYDKSKVNAYARCNKKAVELYYYVQYNLDKQLSDAIQYAHSKRLIIKGDLPIGISSTSVDAWVNPRLFNLDKQAGAPPDDFSFKGQNWGFPTYNWDEMEKDGYGWWKSRFQNMDRYFDAFRIDHILGFFRIWEIPMDCIWGLLGHFSPAMPLSVQNIEDYGIWFDRDRYTRPYITIRHLTELFNEDAEHIASLYMNQISFDRFLFKPEYDTQRKLTICFSENGLLPAGQDVLDKLLSLYCEVIFIEDTKSCGYYHPRIDVSKSRSFCELSAHEKWCVQRIHDDYFYHRHNVRWSMEAMRKLPTLIGVTDMLVCGEDLGMVPSCVPSVMNALQILSLEVQRMPKEVAARYVDLERLPYLSVCCTGTHDTSTLRSWWRENRDNTQWYYNNVLHRDGEAPQDLDGELASEIVNDHLQTKNMWTILPWQDYMACDERLRYPDPDYERINDPSNPNHVWCWRMHVDLE